MLDIPSKYIEDFCVIISVDVDIFSEELIDTSCIRSFPFGFCHFSSYG